MSNKIQVFDLSNASNVSLTSTGFKKEGESAKYVCKITDATISPMLPLFSWATTQSSTLTRRRSCSTLSPSHFPSSNRKSSKEFLMRRREIVDRTVNTKVRSSSKWNWSTKCTLFWSSWIQGRNDRYRSNWYEQWIYEEGYWWGIIIRLTRCNSNQSQVHE